MTQPTTSYVITGAGAPAVATARLLAESGTPVRQISRRGGGFEHPLVDRIAADATDTARLTELLTGSGVLINCAIPPYHRWAQEVPPLAQSLLDAARATGVRYVMLGNLYGYGPVEGPMSEELPLAATTVKGVARVQMWEQAIAAHQAGEVQVTEVRAGAFLGFGAQSLYTLMVAPQVLRGEPASFPGDLDAPRSWSDVTDVARTLIAASTNDAAWGRAWHVPSNDVGVRDLTERLAELAGSGRVDLQRLPAAQLEALAAQDETVAELLEMRYSLDNPDLLSSQDAEAVLGVQASALDDVLHDTIRGLSTST